MKGFKVVLMKSYSDYDLYGVFRATGGAVGGIEKKDGEINCYSFLDSINDSFIQKIAERHFNMKGEK